MKPNTNLHEET